jgi:hypothetical protein
MKLTRTLLTCVAAVLLGHHTPVDAAFVYQQNFDGLTTGTMSGQDGWFGTANDVVQTGTALGQKALQVVSSDSLGRTSIFAPLTHPTNLIQQVDFAFRFTATIDDYSGTPNTDIQQTMQFRGPVTFHESFLVYKGITDGSGNVVQNRLELRSRGPGNVSATVVSPSTVQKDTWYHATLVYDWGNFVLDGNIRNVSAGGVFWDPAPQSIAGGLDGNLNMVILSADNTPSAPWFFDNFSVDVPEPAAALLLGLGGLLLWRRR